MSLSCHHLSCHLRVFRKLEYTSLYDSAALVWMKTVKDAVNTTLQSTKHGATVITKPVTCQGCLSAAQMDQGRSDGGRYQDLYPPKSAKVNFLWGKNDVRTAIQQFYPPPKTFIPPKTNYWLRP